MISRHLQTPSTCPFDARKLPTEKSDTWISMQRTTTNSPSTRRLQRWTTSTQSRQATHCRHSDVLNEVTFQRNNLNWTLVGNHTGTIKVTPRVQVPSSFPLGLAAKKGRCWDPCLTYSWTWNVFRPCSVMFGTRHQEATFSRVCVT